MSELSCNLEEFAKAAVPFDIAMKTSGYRGGLSYDNHDVDTQAGKRNCKSNIVWFNLPFSKNLKNSISKEFLKLADRHFLPHHHLQKVCNCNTRKVSYNCMTNMATKSSHSINLLSKEQKPKSIILPCNFCNSGNCPLKGKCREKIIIYKAWIRSGDISKHYFGCTETEFKTRYYNCTHSFRYREKIIAT